MLFGEWWVANPTDDDDVYEPPSDRVPGVLRETASGEYVLETIGFLGAQPFPVRWLGIAIRPVAFRHLGYRSRRHLLQPPEQHTSQLNLQDATGG